MSSFHFLMLKNCCFKLDLLVYKRILWTHLTTLIFLFHLLAHMLMRQTEVNSTLKLRKTLEVIITCSRSHWEEVAETGLCPGSMVPRTAFNYCILLSFFFLFVFLLFLKKVIYFSQRLIILQYCGGFCHTLTWISHGSTCVPHCLSKRNKSLCSQVIHGQFTKTDKKIINYKTTKTARRDTY